MVNQWKVRYYFTTMCPLTISLGLQKTSVVLSCLQQFWIEAPSFTVRLQPATQNLKFASVRRLSERHKNWKKSLCLSRRPFYHFKQLLEPATWVKLDLVICTPQLQVHYFHLRWNTSLNQRGARCKERKDTACHWTRKMLKTCRPWQPHGQQQRERLDPLALLCLLFYLCRCSSLGKSNIQLIQETVNNYTLQPHYSHTIPTLCLTLQSQEKPWITYHQTFEINLE